jgi:hypothetical protein
MCGWSSPSNHDPFALLSKWLFQMDVTFSLTSQLHVCCHVSVIINLSLLAKILSRFSQAKMALAPACILRWEFIFRCQSFR